VTYPLPPELRFNDRMLVYRAVRSGRAVEDARLHVAALQYARHLQRSSLGSNRPRAHRTRIAAWVASCGLAVVAAIGAIVGATVLALDLAPPAMLLAGGSWLATSRARGVAKARCAEAAQLARDHA
jgi:hypothetical protein